MQSTKAQSIELMPGHQFIFTDVQFFKGLDSRYRNSVFSRTRARIDYGEDAPVFFSGLYLNHTFNSGLGFSVKMKDSTTIRITII